MVKNINSVIKEIDNKKWRKRGKWPISVIGYEIFGEGEATASSKKLGYPFKKTRGVWLSNGDYFDIEEDWEALGKIVRKEYAKDKGYLLKYAKHCLKVGNELIKFSEKIGHARVDKLKDKELAEIYEKLILKCKEFMPFMFSLHLFDEFLTHNFELLLKNFIAKNKLPRSSYFEYQTALTVPFRKIFVLEERINLLKIAADINKHKLDLQSLAVKEKIKKHTEKFGWINISMFDGLPYNEKYFAEKVRALLKIDANDEYGRIIKEEVNLRMKQKRAMDKIKLDKDLYVIAEAVQIFGFLRSFRIDALFVAYFNCWDIVREISKRLMIEEFDIKYLSSSETKKALDKKINYKKLIADRKKGLCGVMINSKRYEFTGLDREIIVKHIKLPKEKKVESELRGSIAYPGKIIAQCKILHKLEDMKKIKSGDILVISMTDPNYIPAMEKASAFITDMGGILCHAAIVAREMKKPCIIGTKIATRVLRDGDMAEVDANRGVVKILKKK